MAEDPSDPEPTFVLDLPPWDFRDWLHRQTKSVRFAVDGGIGATVIGCWLGVWLSSGEAVIIIPVLIFGTLVGWLGLATATNLETRWKVLWSLILLVISVAVGVITYMHMHPITPNKVTSGTPPPHVNSPKQPLKTTIKTSRNHPVGNFPASPPTQTLSAPGNQASSSPNHDPIVSAVTAFNSLSNQDLKRHVHKMAESLRTFESNYEKQIKTIADAPDAPDQAVRVTRELQAAQIAEQTSFQGIYIPELRALTDELLTRLKLPQPLYDQDGLSPDGRAALHSGSVYGVHPLTDIADYVESLASRLPN